MYKVIIGVVIVTVIAIVGFMIIDPNVNVTRVDEISLVESNLDAINATVEGEIQLSGTYSLSEGSTMSDLIKAAGGLTREADERAFYQEAVVEKNMTYYIAGLYDYSDVCNNSAVSKVNINTDYAETLMSINGFSSSIAASVVSYRNVNGQFKTIEDLMNVYGIGNATYKKVRDYVILHV